MKWQDLPEKKNCFTTRSAVLINLDNNKILQYYSANTKIVVVQKCITKDGTYYRTESASRNGLNWAFKASAFGLPDEKAPSAHHSRPDSLDVTDFPPKVDTSHTIDKKTNKYPKTVLPKDGEARRVKSWLRKIFKKG